MTISHSFEGRMPSKVRADDKRTKDVSSEDPSEEHRQAEGVHFVFVDQRNSMTGSRKSMWGLNEEVWSCGEERWRCLGLMRAGRLWWEVQYWKSSRWRRISVELIPVPVVLDRLTDELGLESSWTKTERDSSGMGMLQEAEVKKMKDWNLSGWTVQNNSEPGRLWRGVFTQAGAGGERFQVWRSGVEACQHLGCWFRARVGNPDLARSYLLDTPDPGNCH